MSEVPRPVLKLKLGSSAKGSSSAASPAPVAAAAVAAAAASPSANPTPKLKIRFGPSSTSKNESAPSVTEPAAAPTKIKLKQPKKAKPSNISTTKKREHDSIADPEYNEKPMPKTATIKKIKLTTSKKTPTTPFIKLKGKGKPPPRPQGAAYDSEASDREVDPAIEEEFILRMIPGDDCEYIRKAIEEKRWGGRAEKGADIRLKFLEFNGRRAILTIRNKIYAAALVDMPCLVEGMKSWDRRAWYKAADICQMLLVLGTVNSEAEAMEYPLPPGEVDKATWQYAHGLTPPMRWVRKRRFKKRVSTRTIEAVEEEVERLLRQDAEAVGKTRYELVDLDRLSKGPSRAESAQPESEYEAGANRGSVYDDYFSQEVEQEEDEDALAAQFELAMQEDEDADAEGDVEEEETPAETPVALPDANVTDSAVATPAAGTTSKEDSGDEESDEEEEELDVDEDVLEQRADLQRQREEIADLEAVIQEQLNEMNQTENKILKARRLQKIESLRSDLELKKRAIGEGEDDD